MRVSIYSLKSVLYDDEAASVNCQTEAGEITILDRHAPLITVLKPGTIVITNSSKKDQYFNVSGGFLEVGTKNTAKLIVKEA